MVRCFVIITRVIQLLVIMIIGHKKLSLIIDFSAAFPFYIYSLHSIACVYNTWLENMIVETYYDTDYDWFQLNNSSNYITKRLMYVKKNFFF